MLVALPSAGQTPTGQLHHSTASKALSPRQPPPTFASSIMHCCEHVSSHVGAPLPAPSEAMYDSSSSSSVPRSVELRVALRACSHSAVSTLKCAQSPG